jgi:LysR family transcriptional regulator, hydrogen peroxide-inducible genes activator
MISLKQLHYFDLLAASGHFGQAAENAGISQPALSMQIRDLEAALGGALVERRSGGARLTALGAEVAARGRRILGEARDLEDLAFVQGPPLAGPLRLGVIPSIAPYLLPKLLGLARKQYPSLKLSVREAVTAALVEGLAAAELDAIVASLPLASDDIAEEAVFDDTFLLAAPKDSPHARRSPALAEAIAAEELLLLEDGHCLRDQALDVCHAIDPRRLKSFGATSLATLLELVAAGQGITLLPRLAAGAAAERRVRLVRFTDPEPKRTVAVAWRKNSPRLADFRALADLVREAGRG